MQSNVKRKKMKKKKSYLSKQEKYNLYILFSKIT